VSICSPSGHLHRVHLRASLLTRHPSRRPSPDAYKGTKATPPITSDDSHNQQDRYNNYCAENDYDKRRFSVHMRAPPFQKSGDFLTLSRFKSPEHTSLHPSGPSGHAGPIHGIIRALTCSFGVLCPRDSFSVEIAESKSKRRFGIIEIFWLGDIALPCIKPTIVNVAQF
jgi:hypothetical protein